MENHKIFFYKVVKIVEENNDDILLGEFKEKLLYDEGLFNYTGVIENDRIYDIYSTRNEIQKENKSETVIGYESLLKEIKKHKEGNAEVGSFAFVDCTYFLFIGEKLNGKSLGILKSLNITMDKKLKLNKDYEKIGVTSDSIRFKQAQLV